MAKKATTTKTTKPAAKPVVKPTAKQVKQERVPIIKETPVIKEELEVQEPENKSFKDFDNLIYKAITSKIFPGVDMNTLYKDYLESNIGTNDNNIINWAIKKLL